MRNSFYLASLKKISLVVKESISHKHSDAIFGKNQSVQIDVQKIDNIFYKKSYTKDTKKPRQIGPDDIFVQYNKKYIQHQQKNECLGGKLDKDTCIVSDNMKNRIYIYILFHNLFSQHDD